MSQREDSSKIRALLDLTIPFGNIPSLGSITNTVRYPEYRTIYKTKGHRDNSLRIRANRRKNRRAA